MFTELSGAMVTWVTPGVTCRKPNCSEEHRSLQTLTPARQSDVMGSLG